MWREGFELANCQGSLVVGQREGWVESSGWGGDFMNSLDNRHFCSSGLGLLWALYMELSLTDNNG